MSDKVKNSYNKIYFVFIFLSLFHIPIVSIGNDFIGLYDFYIVLLFIYFSTKSVIISSKWKLLFLMKVLYSIYLLFGLIRFGSLYSVLLVSKQFEIVIIFFVTYKLFYTIENDTLLKHFEICVDIMMLFQLASYFRLFRYLGLKDGLGYGIWYQLGLPFMNGVSSNPSGFILGAILILRISTFKNKNIVSIIRILFNIIALLLTSSRTNILASVAVICLFLISVIIRKPKYLLNLIIIFVIVISAIVQIISFLPSESLVWRIVNLFFSGNVIENILEQGSFKIRYSQMWKGAFAEWNKNFITLLFGNGEGWIQVVDGSVPRLLSNQGIIGLIFFIFNWFIIFIIIGRKTNIWTLLLYFTINAISAETLITSFRSIQAIIPIIFLMINKTQKTYSKL